MTTNLPNNIAYRAKIFTAFGKPTVEERFKEEFRFGIKSVMVRQPVIGWYWKDSLCGAGNNSMTRLLSLDSAEEKKKVHKRDTARELRLIVEAVDVAAVLGNESERDN